MELPKGIAKRIARQAAAGLTGIALIAGGCTVEKKLEERPTADTTHQEAVLDSAEYYKQADAADPMSQSMAKEAGLTPSLANQYDERFSLSDIAVFLRYVPPEKANAYDERFSLDDIDTFLRDVPPEKANAYDEEFPIALFPIIAGQYRTDPEVANAVRREISEEKGGLFETLKMLAIATRINEDDYRAYPKQFSDLERIRLFSEDISAARAGLYDNNFTAEDVIVLEHARAAGVTPGTANRYMDAVTYFTVGSDGKVEKRKYPLPLSGSDIVYCVRNGIPTGEVREAAMKSAQHDIRPVPR